MWAKGEQFVDSSLQHRWVGPVPVCHMHLGATVHAVDVVMSRSCTMFWMTDSL